MSTYTGKYSDDKASDATFKRDESVCTPRGAGEGKDADRKPQYKDYAGALSDRRKPIDPDLSSSGGNSGYGQKD